MTTEPINIEITEDYEDKSMVTKYDGFVNDNTIEISANESSFIGYDTTKTLSRGKRNTSGFHKINLETGEYLVDGSQINASSVSSILGSNTNKYQVYDFRQRVEDVKNKIQIPDQGNYESTKEAMIYENVKEEEEFDDSEVVPTPIQKAQRWVGSVISITETPKSFQAAPHIALNKDK